MSATTAIAAWTELGESLARAGLRKLVLVTSHGGNVAAMELVARDLRARLGMLAVTVGWHRFGYPDGTFSAEEKKHGIHGGDIETSLMLAAMPDTVRMDKAPNATPATDRDGARIQMARRLSAGRLRLDDAGSSIPTGAVGDATLASAAKRVTRRSRTARRRSSNCCARSTVSICHDCARGRSEVTGCNSHRAFARRDISG